MTEHDTSPAFVAAFEKWFYEANTSGRMAHYTIFKAGWDARDEEVKRLRDALTEIANGNLWGIPQIEWQQIARRALAEQKTSRE